MLKILLLSATLYLAYQCAVALGTQEYVNAACFMAAAALMAGALGVYQPRPRRR